MRDHVSEEVKAATVIQMPSTKGTDEQPPLADMDVELKAGLDTQESVDQPDLQEKQRYYGVELNGTHLLLSDGFSSGQVIVNPSVYRIPNSPSCYLGLCYARGELVPVYQLDQSLMVGANSDDEQGSGQAKDGVSHDRYLLIIGQKDGYIGFLMANLPRQYSLAEEKFKSYAVENTDSSSGSMCPAAISPLIMSAVKAFFKDEGDLYLKFSWVDFSKILLMYISSSNLNKD